ncbi:MAG TPA: hypothetical protein DCZ95_08125 [Verrucomicrobia bacterium]|nr:hypothetical protein [Verrucomicrobiota bacterium]
MDEVIQAFNENGVRYLLIGGQALRLEGMPRFSMDWDFFLPARDLANLDLINRVLGAELDMPLVPLGSKGENLIQTYQTRWGIMQFHLAVAGMASFDEAEKRKVICTNENGVPVACLHPEDLLICKRKVGRPQDMADIAFLEEKLSQ